MKVIDPTANEGTNSRFWKFASELLFASMSIYDKRVENMYHNTNRMFDNLIRMHDNSKKIEEAEEDGQSQKDKRQRLREIDVRDIGKV